MKLRPILFIAIIALAAVALTFRVAKLRQIVTGSAA